MWYKIKNAIIRKTSFNMNPNRKNSTRSKVYTTNKLFLQGAKQKVLPLEIHHTNEQN